MENAIETVKRGGFTAHIYYDTDSLGPRKDCDNLGKIVSRRLTSEGKLRKKKRRNLRYL